MLKSSHSEAQTDLGSGVALGHRSHPGQQNKNKKKEKTVLTSQSFMIASLRTSKGNNKKKKIKSAGCIMQSDRCSVTSASRPDIYQNVGTKAAFFLCLTSRKRLQKRLQTGSLIRPASIKLLQTWFPI